ncbi:MAG: class I SAM-dependent methyltransferase [Acidimicrobiales bacterium]
MYRDHGTGGVSWFQPAPTAAIALIRGLDIPADAAVLDVGGGASTLLDALLADGYRDLSVLDISTVALAALRQRLGARDPVTLIHADLLSWTPERSFDLWHDRAVFHFLVEDRDRQRYVDLLHRALRTGGHVVVGTFAPDGPQYCSGLPVARYTTEEMAEALGGDFRVLDHVREKHTTPAGVVQPFNWLAARLQK